MRLNVVIPIALVLFVLVGGWAYLGQVNNVSPQTEEELPIHEDEQRPFPPDGDRPMGERDGFFQGVIHELQALVNASAEPEELLEFVVNMTDQMEAMLNETEEVFAERMAPMLEFIEGLEPELQGLIDQGASSQGLLDHVTEKMDELMEGMAGRSKRG
ncbi:MAG: hypothetical protein NWE88_05815 [Candidatus Bathyarchaeota archaeon]|nr:hypothetical protein [Candidatus Bathyarchaeota archaeon]